MKFWHSFKLPQFLQKKIFRGLRVIHLAGILAAVTGIIFGMFSHNSKDTTQLPKHSQEIDSSHQTEASSPLPPAPPKPVAAPPLQTSAKKSAVAPLTFTHTNIVTTVFWVGEGSSADNGHISNTASAWDENWQANYGGVDSPGHRKNYMPVGFVPKENPFYFALPYSDVDNNGNRKPTAAQYLPLAFAAKSAYPWFKNSWIAIKHGDKIAYAQWEDVGPFGEDDAAYVFGKSNPRNTDGVHAGLDVSPALKEFLGLNDVSLTDWTFVHPNTVPPGPWRTVVTNSKSEIVN